MKKICFIAVLLIWTSSAFALGAGVQISGTPTLVKSFENDSKPSFAISENISGTFKMERVPIVISGGLDLLQAENIFNFGFSFSGDYLFFENQIKNFVNWYGGAGISGGFLFDKKFHPTLNGGLRFLLGVNVHLYTGYLELYAQEVVSPGVIYWATSNSLLFDLAFPLEMGIRLHF